MVYTDFVQLTQLIILMLSFTFQMHCLNSVNKYIILY